jgi:hypothetical protein
MALMCMCKKLFSLLARQCIFQAIVIEGVAGVGEISTLNHDLELLLCCTPKQRLCIVLLKVREIHKQ